MNIITEGSQPIDAHPALRRLTVGDVRLRDPDG